MRGFAVLVMVMGHSMDAVLSPAARTTELFHAYDTVRGFTAPLFLFISGFAFTLATEKRWESFRSLGRPILQRLLRILLLFVIGYSLHFPFFSLEKLLHHAGADQMAQFLQVDVLHCVAATMLLLQVFAFLAPSPAAAARLAAGAAAAIVLTAPVIWSVDLGGVLSPVLSPYVNQQQLSLFPVFPYGAYMLTGAAGGHLYLRARASSRERIFLSRLVTGASLATIVALLLAILPFTVYPTHDVWKASPAIFLLRIAAALVLTRLFFSVKAMPDPAARTLTALGQASLLIYTVHLALVYGSPINQGLLQHVGQQLPSVPSVGVALCVLAAMIGLIHLWNYLRLAYTVHLRFAQVWLASTLLYLFLTKPY